MLNFRMGIAQCIAIDLKKYSQLLYKKKAIDSLDFRQIDLT
jgi:hypothetical protein